MNRAAIDSSVPTEGDWTAFVLRYCQRETECMQKGRAK